MEVAALTHRQRLVSFEFRDAILLVATRGLFCWHPDWPRYAINVLYTERYPAGQQPATLDDEVGPFRRRSGPSGGRGPAHRTAAVIVATLTSPSASSGSGR